MFDITEGSLQKSREQFFFHQKCGNFVTEVCCMKAHAMYL